MSDQEDSKQLQDLVARYSEEAEADLYVFSGEIVEESAHNLRETLTTKDRKKNASLFLTTNGGDAHAAYRAARSFQDNYVSFRLLLVGTCKSAGTLVAIGAHEIAFGTFGELGPLDVQLRRPNELIPRISGLDTIQSFEGLAQRAFTTFENTMLDIHRKSFGAISTKLACEIATELVAGVFQPIASQIDPHRLGEVDRMMQIAYEYAVRLKTGNVKDHTIDSLLNRYPTHGFIIDQREAGWLFENVESLTELETALAVELSDKIEMPADSTVIMDFREMASLGGGKNGEKSAEDPRASDLRDGGKDRLSEEDEGQGTTESVA